MPRRGAKPHLDGVSRRLPSGSRRSCRYALSRWPTKVKKGLEANQVMTRWGSLLAWRGELKEMEDEKNTKEVLNAVKYQMMYVEASLLKMDWKDKQERGQSLLLGVGGQTSRPGRRSQTTRPWATSPTGVGVLIAFRAVVVQTDM